jgi:tryptophan-rich hypothetical protein
VIQPELGTDLVGYVEIESVYSKATQIINWRDLQNNEVWLQGWVTNFAMPVVTMNL